MIRAYHFVGDKLRDERPVPPDGEWLVHDGPVKMCESGLHASRHPFDALTYAPGPILCLVDCDEIDAEENDKLVCRRRRIVARFDATTMLRTFARRCALDVIHLWKAPQVVRDYLTTGDESLRDGTSSAAWNAVNGYTKEAAWSAAAAANAVPEWAAKNAASAAQSAVWATARAAVRNGAWAAARDGTRDAARAAAKNAAWAAARDAQRERFARLVDDEFTKVKDSLTTVIERNKP